MKPRTTSLLKLGWIRTLYLCATAKSGKIDLASQQVAVNRSVVRILRNDVQPERENNLVISGAKNYHVHSERALFPVSGFSRYSKTAMNSFIEALSVACNPMY